MNVVFFSLRTKTADNEQWWTAMLKKAWKVKKIKLYVNSVFKQPSKLQTALKMNVVFFSLRTKTADNEQWWTAMLKKAWKVKKIKLYVNSVFKQPSKLQIVLKMNVVFFSLRTKTAEDEQWWTAMLKKAWKVKKFKLYGNSVFKQPSKLQTALKMNVVFFSLRTKTADNEQWWTAILKKKVKKIKHLIQSSQPKVQIVLKWTLFSSLFVPTAKKRWTAMLKKREKLKKLNFTQFGLQTAIKTPNCLEDERCFLLSSYEDGRGWWTS